MAQEGEHLHSKVQSPLRREIIVACPTFQIPLLHLSFLKKAKIKEL
jgi:hypothetical protein